jgi:hypothetical protein
MRVTDAKPFREYDADPRFANKKPYRYGSRKQSCGDNIYFRNATDDGWCQRDSFHTRPNGAKNLQHVARDTSVDRVLIGDEFIYFGGEGPKIPAHLKDGDGRPLCKAGIGRSVFSDPQLIADFHKWLLGLGASGYQGAPFEWISLRD